MFPYTCLIVKTFACDRELVSLSEVVSYVEVEHGGPYMDLVDMYDHLRRKNGD